MTTTTKRKARRMFPPEGRRQALETLLVRVDRGAHTARLQGDRGREAALRTGAAMLQTETGSTPVEALRHTDEASYWELWAELNHDYNAGR